MKKNVDISDPAFRGRFRRLRDRANITQAELAARAGVSARTVHNIEGAIRGVAQEKTLRLLAEALGVSYEHLLSGPPEKPPHPSSLPVAGPAPRRRLSTVFLAVLVTVAVLAGGFAVNDWRMSPRATDDAGSVMVTCFEYGENADDPERLGRIVRDLVVNGLSESRYVRVLSCPDAVHPDPGMHHTLELQAAADAGVQRALFGSILRDGSRLVLVSRLESVSDGTVLATQKVTAANDETIFDLAAHLAAQVKRDLAVSRGGGTEAGLPIARVTTQSIKAYRHYVEGVDNLNKLYRDEARAALRQAVADDSTFAMALVMLVHPEIAGQPEDCERFLAAARRHAEGLTPRERYYLDAFSAWNRRDVHGAIAVCEALVEDYPQESEAYRLLARFYDALRERTKALAALETAVEVDPFDGMSLNRLGYQYVRVGRYDKAIECIDRYVRLAPSQANPYDTRGDLLAWTGRPDEAIASYKMALDHNPTFFPAMQNLGCVFTLTGRYDEAERYFRMMLGSEDEGARSRARWFLGMMEVHRGRLDRAEMALRKALAADDLEDNRSDAYLQKLCAIASIQYERGDREAGLATYRAAMDTLQRHRPNETAEWPINYICMLARVDMQAAEALRDSLELRLRTEDENRNHVLRACDGWIQLHQGNAVAACRSFERALADHDVFEYRYPLALASLEAGRVDDAIRTLEYSMNRYSSSRVLSAIWGVKMYYHLGRAYELAGRQEEASAMYARFLDVWNGADPAFDEIGDAQARVVALDQNQ